MAVIDIVNIVKSKAKKAIVKYQIPDDDVLLAVQEINQRVINYCKVTEVPAALSFTVANMAVDLLLYTAEKNAAGDTEVDMSRLSSLNIGDTLIKFDSELPKASERQQTLSSHKSKLDSIILNYTQQLNEFRRLV